MLLNKISAKAIVSGLFVLASASYAGCSSQPTVKYASYQTLQQATAQVVPQTTAAPTPVPTPNPDQAAGLVTRFYRDVASNTKDSMIDFGAVVSADFMHNHQNDLTAAYGFIRDPKVQVIEVRGRTLNYSLDYYYRADNGVKLYWERTGRWIFDHGVRSGWVLDRDTWNSVHLIAVSEPNDPNLTHVQDKTFSDGRHEFDYHGQRYSFVAKGNGWSLTALASPPPSSETEPSGAPTGNGWPAPAQPYVAGAPAVSADCEEVNVEDVYDDGKILDLDDGRHLSVADYETATSSVWVAPFDGLVCHGDRFINKDDNEAVDLAE